MHRAANKIDFLTSQSSKLGFADFEIPVRAGKLFQHILTNRLSDVSNSRNLFTRLARQLIQFAEHSYCLRDWKELENISSALMNLPISGVQQAGLYYQAIIKYQRGQKAEADNQYKKIADNAPYIYRARATQALGMTQREQGYVDEALRFNLEALRMVSSNQGKNLLTSLRANWEIAVIKSISGDHNGALTDFEKLSPIIQLAAKQHSYFYYVYHNALAVEFSELGRISEAENAINIAFSSPFASAYPEWSETREEIEQKRNYPDPSRCFLERSIAEPEATQDSNTFPSATIERQAEERASSQHQSAVETKPLREVAFYRFIKSVTCQRPLTLPNADKTIIPGEKAKSFLQRLGRSVQLRGPPAFSLS